MKPQYQISILLSAICAIYLSMTNTKADDFPEGPPSNGVGETSLHDPAFVAACMSRLMTNPVFKTWNFRPPLVTYNNNWGATLRVDFTLPGQDISVVKNRLVCWRAAEGKIEYRFFYALPGS